MLVGQGALGAEDEVRRVADRLGAGVATALTRMTLLSGTALTDSIALEVARRENVKAVISGEVATLGSGFVLTGRVVEAATGETRAAVRWVRHGSATPASARVGEHA